MYIVNHFLDVQIAPNVQVPDRLRADDTNSKESIDAQTRICQGLHNGAKPNYVLLNFIDQGDWPRQGTANDGFICDLLGGFGIGC